MGRSASTTAVKKSSWYKKDKKANPRKYRLKNIFNGIERREERKLDVEERAYIEREFDQHVNSPCAYCQTEMVMKSISCDHIVPISRNGSKRVFNLQFICLSCNFMKGNLTGAEFQILMNFLNTNEEMKKIVSQRLRMSGIIFTHRK